jgi:hypothetical protein
MDQTERTPAYKKDLVEIAEEMMRQSTAVKTKELATFS